MALAAWTVSYHVGLVLKATLPTMAAAALLLTGALAFGVKTWLTPRMPARPGAPLTATAWAVAFSVLSVLLNRPDADDIVFVGKSVFVAEQGIVPSRDTVFTAGIYPAIASTYPPVSSWETLLGGLARMLGIEAGSITYLIATPAAAALAVLALHRLLRAWLIPIPGWALSAACVFLLWGGTHHASFGNLHIGRIWQGKVYFLAIIVPCLYAWGTEWLRGRSVGTLVLMVSASVAGVGLTTTSFILVPLIAVVLAAASLYSRKFRCAFAVLIIAIYPFTLAIFSVLFPGEVALLPGSAPQTQQVIQFVFGTGLALVPVVGAVAVGWLGVTAEGRVVAVTSMVVAAVAVSPWFLAVIDQLTGAGDILWRMLWIIPLPALVGAATSWIAGLPEGALFRHAVASLAILSLIASGRPLWSASNWDASLARPAWKVPSNELAAARDISETALRSGAQGPVLAPTETSYALSVLTSEIHPVVSRPNYLAALAAYSPESHAEDRALLARFADGSHEVEDGASVTAALEKLEVQMACVSTVGASDEFLLSFGWTRKLQTPTCDLFLAPSVGDGET